MTSRVKHLIWGAAMAGLSASAAAQNVHWLTTGDPLTSAVAPSIFLTDNNVDEVDRFLAGQSLRIVKIPEPVTGSTVAAIYDKYKIDFTFADLEGPDAVARTTALVSQIKASAGTGAYVQANKAFVGNYAFAPLYTDTTARPGTAWAAADYHSAGLNMSTESLYPGQGGYRNPTTGDSAAPNVRSALFTLPIERLSTASAQITAGHAHVPYVNRFNNWGNAALDTDGNPSNGIRFETADQLPSRGDFQAQVFHYRLRGATGVHGLDGGVEGYTPAQFEADIQAGWNGPAKFASVLADPAARKLTLDTVANVDGVVRPIEETGVVYSGEYSIAQGKLVMLVSNLDEQSHTLTLPAVIGGKVVTGSYPIGPGSHEVLEFGATGGRWDFIGATAAFADSDRAGVGVPEPTGALVVLGAGVIAMASRRRRA